MCRYVYVKQKHLNVKWVLEGPPTSDSPAEGERMKGYEELLQENQALRKRLSRLNKANLRINESLEFDTVSAGAIGFCTSP